MGRKRMEAVTMKRAECRFSRRAVLGASLAAGGLASAHFHPVLAALRAVTPAQSLGPFYPAKKPLDQDNDLTSVAGASSRAEGKLIHVTGRVIDRDGKPEPGAAVEIWQANASGRYHHIRGRRDVPLDPNFQGYGRDRTDDEGA